MADHSDDLLRRPLYLYGLPAEVLNTLVPKDVTAAAEAASIATAADTASRGGTRPSTPAPSEPGTAPESPADAASITSAPASGQACGLCGLTFSSVAEQRGHLKSDLHHFNLKQKLRGQAAVAEVEFERLVGNLDESLSGSDWSESEEDDDDEDVGGSDGKGDPGSGNVLAALLKKQAVLADKRARTAASEAGDPAAASRAADKTATTKQQRAAAAETASLQPLVWFSSPVLPENSYFGVYRALFTREELGLSAEGAAVDGDEADAAPRHAARLLDAVRSRQLAPISGAVAAAAAKNVASSASLAASLPPPSAYGGRHVFLCMIGGGHFAAMVVALAPRRASAKAGGGASASNAGGGAASSVPMNREATVLAHKTFHRYTTRRKQGGSQSANDAAKGAAHSAGSSLRRYNEQALVDDVRALLRDWKRLLDAADLLFVRATGTTNQRALFGPYDGQVLQPRDPRLRSFPFNTRRPTQKEIMRAFIELTRLKVREIVPRAAAVAGTSATASDTPAPAAASSSKPPKRSEEEETALLHTTQLQALARRSRVPALLAYLKASSLSAAGFRFAPPDTPQHHHAPTLLHLAASQNAPALVSALLLRAAADPTATNHEGKTAFELAGDRATRDAFRVARGELAALGSPESSPQIDWDAARVPAPMTRAEAEQRDARDKEDTARKEAERRRAEEARLKAEAASASSVAGPASNARKRTVGVPKSAQELREEEARGLTPEQRRRLERERRARAAEARMRRAQEGA